MDVVNKLCHIYAMDHTLWKTIPLPTPEGYYLEEIQYLSEKLFNQDNLIELVYIYSKYVPTETSYYFTYETKLINENGNTLLTFPGSGFTQVIETPENGKKFMVYEYNFSVIPYRTSTHVYSLPEPAVKSSELDVSSILRGKAYPNPAAGEVVIPLQVPKGVNHGSVELFSPGGAKILSYPFSGTPEQVILPVRQLAPGTYFYRVNAGGIVYAPEKIVVQ
jgi:hypothetical protein